MAQDELTNEAEAQAVTVENYLRKRWNLDLDSESSEDIMQVIITLNEEASLANLSDAQLGHLVRLLVRPVRYRAK
jgi:hypothetical protein